MRAAGIEPALLSERDFESRASTNSTTPARRWTIASSPGRATPNVRYGAYVVAFAVFLRAVTGACLALRTLTAEASMVFVKCRP